MSYLDNLLSSLRDANKKSLKYGDGRAWENVKVKNAKRMLPRGKAFTKLINKQLTSKYNNLKSSTEKLIEEYKNS